MLIIGAFYRRREVRCGSPFYMLLSVLIWKLPSAHNAVSYRIHPSSFHIRLVLALIELTGLQISDMGYCELRARDYCQPLHVRHWQACAGARWARAVERVSNLRS